MSVEEVIQRHEEIQRAGDALVDEQRSKALALAWVRRSQLKELRKAFKAREVDPLQVLAGECDPRIEKVVAEVRLKSLLPLIPGLGQARSHDVLTAFGVSGTRKLGNLTAERRRELVFIVKGARDPHYAV